MNTNVHGGREKLRFLGWCKAQVGVHRVEKKARSRGHHLGNSPHGTETVLERVMERLAGMSTLRAIPLTCRLKHRLTGTLSG